MKKALMGIFVFMIVGMFISATTVNAYRGDYTAKGPDYTLERHEAMEQAFDNLDYNAWKDLMTNTGRNPRVVQVVNEGNFETFVMAHQAGENGDYELAAKLRSELGLNNGNGPKDGSGYKQGSRQGSGMGSSGQGRGMGRGSGQGRGDCQI